MYVDGKRGTEDDVICLSTKCVCLLGSRRRPLIFFAPLLLSLFLFQLLFALRRNEVNYYGTRGLGIVSLELVIAVRL